MIVALSIVGIVIIGVVVYLVYSQDKPPADVVVHIDAFDIPIVIPEEKLAGIPVHKVVRAKIRKHVAKKGK